MLISRNFLLVGSLFLIIGISIGIYMGASGDRTLAPLHAHINLLGFVLMSVFGLVYKAFPNMAASGLATIHFWLHTVGSIVLLIMLGGLLTGRISEAAMVPVAPIAEVAILVGIICFVLNLLPNGK